MSSDEQTQLEDDAPIVRGREAREVLPWVLFLAALTAFIGTTVFLVLKCRTETDRANNEYADKTAAEARASQCDEALTGEKLKSTQFAAQVKALSGERDALSLKVKAADAALAAAKSKPVAKAPVKKPVVKKRK